MKEGTRVRYSRAALDRHHVERMEQYEKSWWTRRRGTVLAAKGEIYVPVEWDDQCETVAEVLPSDLEPDPDVATTDLRVRVEALEKSVGSLTGLVSGLQRSAFKAADEMTYETALKRVAELERRLDHERQTNKRLCDELEDNRGIIYRRNHELSVLKLANERLQREARERPVLRLAEEAKEAVFDREAPVS